MRVSIAGTGDIMLGTDFPENHLPDDDGVSFLEAVSPLLKSADIAFGNLEGVLVDGGEPVKQCKDPQACYLFRSPERYAYLLRAAGFDVMSLANNHARDFGEAGRDASMAALTRVNILHSGREGDIASWRQDDLSFALIAFSPTVDSWPLLEIDVAVEAITELAARHDIVIISFHGGAEGFDGAERIGFGMEYAYGEQRGNVVAFAHAVIDAGADLVLGHGPHVPRAMELYNDRLIAYSLGNFATYYGIGVTGAKGYAPVVTTTLDGFGRFAGGQIHSNIQIRPGGPKPDPEQRAMIMIRELTNLDFPEGQLVIGSDGSLKKKLVGN
ncbi:MAG: CapA family protein [Gammaproteobacteria bacterium]|jgi:poly-gamma-glutamate capsule biosynthesis protein CapA/YwtB (metallophosphatase superfamily)|nr:CapA family protein [Gammaproteobacteria bacterium]HJP05120.1 CapA family protein [Gammaproteobacteria bacterium]